jgi:hypothetical protein
MQIGLDEERLTTLVQSIQESTVSAINASSANMIEALHELASQPTEPATVKVSRDDKGNLVGTIS